MQFRFNRDDKKPSKKEIKLLIIVGLLAVAVIALITALVLQMTVFNTKGHSEMCQSDDCIKTGIIIII